MSNKRLISLNEALNRSDYPEYIKDKVKSFIIENNKNYQKVSTVYLTKCFNKNIFVIKFDLSVKYKNIDYIITILIYIPIIFPNEIRIYFEDNQDFHIDSYYQDLKIIDEVTAELNYEKIINFIPLQQPLKNLINALTDKFTQKFPLFKNQQKIEYCGPCILDEKSSTLIELKPDDLKEIKRSDEDRKRLKDKILKNLEDKLFEIQSTQSQLESIKNEINTSINNYISKTSAKNELEEMNQKLCELKLKLENDVQKLKYNKNIGILDKCEEIVEIKNKEKFKYTIMKKGIEDFLIYINKAFEKKIITFRQAIDETRKLSKELFYISYLAEKNI
jgi:hypothetical protein